MSYTQIVLEAARAAEISRLPLSAEGLPAPFIGKLLNPQEFVATIKAIKGWVEGAYRPERDAGHMIVIPLPEVAGVFRWTRLGETDLQDRPRRLAVPLPDLETLGIADLLPGEVL